MKRDVDLGRRLGEREEGRPETHLQVVGLEEAAQEVGDAPEVGEADVSPTHRPSTWWNIGEMVASESTRKTRPGAMMRRSGMASASRWRATCACM